MSKFRKKPVVIEAVQFTRKIIEANILDDGPLPEGVIRNHARWHRVDRKIHSFLFIIKTLEGNMEVSENDWVITGIKGEIYPCKPDIFEATYEAVL